MYYFYKKKIKEGFDFIIMLILVSINVVDFLYYFYFYMWILNWSCGLIFLEVDFISFLWNGKNKYNGIFIRVFIVELICFFLKKLWVSNLYVLSKLMEFDNLKIMIFCLKFFEFFF